MPKNAEKRAQHTVDYNNEEEIFYWLRNPPGGGIKRVLLLKDEWILTLADKIEAAPTDADRAALAVPCRQLLEKRDPTAYYEPEEVEALERSRHAAGEGNRKIMDFWVASEVEVNLTLLEYLNISNIMTFRKG